jgi:Tol biopolymer transport system component
MQLKRGDRLGPYEVLAPLGAGGMGEVYRATDPRLGRQVAIKVLPQDLASDPDRLSRFEREARAASSLNHPNILTVHEFGHHGEAPFLVTELLEGESLRGVLQRGALPLARALDHALQIARGLAAAHAKGIVHRDLKPENLFVTADGRVKILDFGLARLLQVEPGAASGDAATALTQAGAVMGTASYMAPEQVRGEPADACSDCFAFGCVLYEMLTGGRAFARPTAAETMAAILREEPPRLAEARADVPAALAAVVERCLAKRPQERIASGREVLFALELVGAAAGAPPPAATPVPPSTGDARRLRGWLIGGVAGAVLAAVGIVAVAPRGGNGARREPVLSSIMLPENEGSLVFANDAAAAAVSPDGSRIAYLGRGSARPPSVWIRELRSAAVRELPGTGNAVGVFWSPDGRSVGFVANDKLRTVAVDGGPVQVLCDVTDSAWWGAAWSPGGVILFSQKGSLYQIAAAGGTPQLLLERRSPEELDLRFPGFLPDGRRFLYFVRRAEGPNRVYVSSLAADPPKLVHEGQSRTLYARSGHLLYARDGVLVAQRFDERSLEPLGEPQPLVSGVFHHPGNGGANFSVADRGTLAYTEATDVLTELVWRDRQGNVVDRVAEPGRFIGAFLAPDGRRAAVEIEDEDTNQHAVFALSLSGGVRSRMSRRPHDGHHPAWSPDGRQIAFSSTRTGKWLPYRQRADGLGDDTLLFDSPEILEAFPRQWTPDGDAVLAAVKEADGRNRLWLLPVAAGGRATPLTDGIQGALSPDGRWLAAASKESGRYQIHVLPFPALDTRWQVSTDGGSWPRWRPDGRELFFASEGQVLMSVPVRTENGFEAGTPRPLFRLRSKALTPAYPHEYDVGATGDRFLVCQVAEHSARRTIGIVTDWEAFLAVR